MARGIPRPLFLEVPDLSSPKFLEDLENTQNTKKYNIFWKNSTKILREKKSPKNWIFLSLLNFYPNG